MDQVYDIAVRLRFRLSEYLFEHRNVEMNLHINSVEISLCLVEYYLKKQRRIRQDELVWFEAGWYVIQLLEGTEYEDITTDYRELARIVKKFTQSSKSS